MPIDFSQISAVCIESIQAAALASSTGKAGQRGGHGGFNTLTGVIFTEGELYGLLRARYPALQVILAPRTAILQQYLGYWPYRKGLNVDAAVLAKLQADLDPVYFTRGNQRLTPGSLSNKDKRDAYLASLFPSLPLTLGIDPAATLQRSVYCLTCDGVPQLSGSCADLL